MLNLVNGARETVDALLDHPRIQGISFVGSSPVAKYVYQRASANGKRVQAQGGAKNFLVVMPDAEPVLGNAVSNILGSAFGAAGQRCLAGSMLLGVGAAHEAALEQVLDGARQIKVGYGLDPGVELGPVISRAARERIVKAADDGEQSGAQARPRRPRGARRRATKSGFFVGPTIFDGVDPDMRLAQDEIFGPVLCASPRRRLAARGDRPDQRQPLRQRRQHLHPERRGGARVPLRRRRRQHRHQRRRAAPMAYFPFAGMKQSFYGTLHGQGRDAVEFFTDKKVVHRALAVGRSGTRVPDPEPGASGTGPDGIKDRR